MATVRRALPRQSKATKSLSPTTIAEQLANELATKLNITGAKAKRTADEAPRSDSRLVSMRAVNTASQALSAVVESGWKKSKSEATSKATLSSIISSANLAAKHLATLRSLSPGEVDVERAAASVLGKLIALEMFTLAESALIEMHSRLCFLLNMTDQYACHVSIPKPSHPPTDPVVLNLVSTYLAYSLIVKAQSTKERAEAVQDLATALQTSTTQSLLTWLPNFSVLPAKSIDNLLTRTYSALNKLCSSSQTSPSAKPVPTSKLRPTPSSESIFTLRMYALQCLIHTSPGVIAANNFWEQATRSVTTFVKATPAASEEETTLRVLAAYAELVRLAENRSDRDSFMSVGEDGKSFIDLNEHWSSFARRAGDIDVLKKIDTFMQQPSASKSFSSQTVPQNPPPANKQDGCQDLIVEGTTLCNAFTQLCLLLEGAGKQNFDEALLTSIQSSTALLRNSNMSVLLQPSPKTREIRSRDEEALSRIRSKVDRAFEKLRRTSMAFIESYAASSTPKGFAPSVSSIDDALREFLLQCVASLESLLTLHELAASTTRDILTRCIDTLFILSRTKLAVNDPKTFAPAFEQLSCTVIILDSVPANKFSAATSVEDTVDIANYTRCISGAFYNLAGSLYQATRYGNAVPFLVESCSLGVKALQSPRPKELATKDSREKEWAQLEEQLFRRWELLAVCYSKNGDRKHAYNAYKQAILTFPFRSSGLADQCDKVSPDVLFGPGSSSAAKQLVALVDRVSYLGACDLLLSAEEVSLLSTVSSASSPHIGYGSNTTTLDPSIIGAVVERQLESLEPNLWKEGIREIFIRLLRDALQIYTETMPVRRARVLVRCMEFAYRDQIEDVCKALGLASVDEIGHQVERLSASLELNKDAQLLDYISQYRIAAHLWIGLHAHRRNEPEQTAIVAQRADEACRIMKELLTCGSEATSKANRHATSPKVGKKVKSPKVSRIASPRATRITRQRTPAAPRKVAPLEASRDPVTPKPRTRALQPVSFNASQTRTPPRGPLNVDQVAKSTLTFHDFDKFLSLLQMSARVLGFLSLILPKARLLDMTRKLAQRQTGVTSDGYVLASLDLAHEYAILGKTRRSASIFNQALDIVRNGQASEEVAVKFLLRLAGSLALIEDASKSSAIYIEALELSSQLDLERQATSTQQRIHSRAKTLEIAAIAAHVFALVQCATGDISASLDGFLQALRLWNRAIDTLARLNPPSTPNGSSVNSDPFEASSSKAAYPSTSSGRLTQGTKISTRSSERRIPLDDVEWRISEGLLSTILYLAQTYYLRGSAREAEYFARQAAELAEHLNAPAMRSRALANQGEIQLHMGQMEEARDNLNKAGDLLCDIPGIDTVNIRRLKAELMSRSAEEEDICDIFNSTLLMLQELDIAFSQFDNNTFGPRRSFGLSPGTKHSTEVLAPELLASVLSHQLWHLRDDVDDNFNALLEKLVSISYSKQNKAEENMLMAKLTLHGVYDQFRTDMFLSSLTESTIAVPMGMGGKEEVRTLVPSPEIVNALINAENLLWAHLGMTAMRGNAIKVREAAISLVLIGGFRTSLGDRRVDLPSIMASLLDVSASLTLRRDILEAIQHKFPHNQALDDLQWPLLLKDGTSLPRATLTATSRLQPASLSDSEDENDVDMKAHSLKRYWESVREKYKFQVLNPSTLSSTAAIGLPSSWIIINISITNDKSTLFISRREGGSAHKDPLIFCIPLKGRRDHGSGDDEEHLTFDAAIQELQDIVRTSDECTKQAVNIKSDDDEGRCNWWKQRGQLDVRMRELLENIEYCWLGAFKAILNSISDISQQEVFDLRAQFETIFHRALHVKDKKSKSKASAHKKSTSQSQTAIPSQFTLDDSIIKCFSTLSPKCRDEELEDLVYFILDLYQFHGVPIAIAEVDILQLVIDLRAVLEEHAAMAISRKSGGRTPQKHPDEHLFLVLDKNVQALPWESMPVLRGRSVSRIPGIQFLQDRLAFAKWKRESSSQVYDAKDGAPVDPRNGYYILNPSGDLGRTEERFRDWAKSMKNSGWDGVIGRQLTEQQFVAALKSRDLVVYFGHGGGEQYIRSHVIRNLPTCAAVMLWGCSSGALRDMGDFDRTGTPYNYMLAGCPTLVANLWDVTDKDIDKLSQSVFEKLGLNGKEKNPSKTPTSLIAAVAQSRDSCKLKYLTGAAPVVYGIPFYL